MRGSKKAKPAQVLLLFHKQPHLLGLREHILELLLLLRNGLLIVLRINPFNEYTPSVLGIINSAGNRDFTTASKSMLYT